MQGDNATYIDRIVFCTFLDKYVWRRCCSLRPTVRQCADLTDGNEPLRRYCCGRDCKIYRRVMSLFFPVPEMLLYKVGRTTAPPGTASSLMMRSL